MIPPHIPERRIVLSLTLLLLACAASAIFLAARTRHEGSTKDSSIVDAAEQESLAVAEDPASESLIPPSLGPGGPILVITSKKTPFSSYYAEILRNEGLNEFAMVDIDRITPNMLLNHDLVIVGEVHPTPKQSHALATWVQNGGNLIAMRPDNTLAQAIGVHPAGGSLRDAYLSINTATPVGRGLVGASIQFHGEADLYPSDDGSIIATLDKDATSPAAAPAVLLKTNGSGLVAIFTYDLARSVVYTRQGNPAWSGMERDGIPPVRTDDLFYGAASNDPHPDWVDMSKVAIPQADEQQRLLANLILQMNAARKPLPRFWYFPRSLKAVVVMTGDDHGNGGTIGRFEHYEDASPRHCSLAEWQCVRSTSNIFLGSISDQDASAETRKGFEIGLHIFTDCKDWPLESTLQADGHSTSHTSERGADSLYSLQLSAFSELYPDVPAPTTSRVDCITWGDYDTQPKVELAHGIRLDTNYYYWPGPWVQDRPGMFTGSGMPMRFAQLDGSLIDVYQATTQMTDESKQTYPFTVDTLLDNAIGAKEYYGAFIANMHTDHPDSSPSDKIVASAQRRGIPIISAQQLLRWLDGRNSSTFQDIKWNSSELTFTIAAGHGADGLTALLPATSVNMVLSQITVDGRFVASHEMSSAGKTYAAFAAHTGYYVAKYKNR